ncbi:MAG: hypothetical protein SWY16_21565 [Cyanobacteriota bacterium]|nr:hypothetical protein [Cyanobacteriota bacterium]
MQRELLISLTIGSIAALSFEPSHWFSTSASATEALGLEAANGQVLQIEGAVRIERHTGQTVSPTTGTLLYPGDRLLGDRNGRAFVQCSDLTINAFEGSQADSSPCASVESLFARRNRGKCEEDAYRCPNRGGDTITHDDTIPYVISPRRTNLLDDRPMLRWNAVTDASSYTVCLQETGVTVWCREVGTAHMEYPADEPPLQSGEVYLLSIQTDGGAFSLDAPPIPGGLEFELLDAERRARVQQTIEAIEGQDIDETARTLAIAFLYTENGLIAEAIDLLEGLVARGIGTPPIVERLHWLYVDYLAIEPPANPVGSMLGQSGTSKGSQSSH